MNNYYSGFQERLMSMSTKIFTELIKSWRKFKMGQSWVIGLFRFDLSK